MSTTEPAPPRSSTPRTAAATIVLRPSTDGPEVYWVRRGRGLRFFGGFYAFPGGSVDPSDSDVPVEGAGPEEARLIAAAARELFEETGLLCARGAFPASALPPAREALKSGASFLSLLRRLEARLDARDFEPAGRWVTPEYSATRFDAHFFLVTLPAGQEATIDARELAEGEWTAPRAALERWSEGTALLHPPQRHFREVLASARPEERAAALRDPPWVVDGIGTHIEFQRGIVTVPLRTPTLPPARHTNAYLVGTGEMVLVDPGSPDREEQRRLEEAVRRLEWQGQRLTAILVTHAHPDHIGGLESAAHAFQVPVLAHAATAQKVPRVDRLVGGGDTLVLAGDPPFTLEVLQTPGHARGHLCFFEPKRRALLCGDMVSGASTIIIDPPEGDMAEYLESLGRLAALNPEVLYPAHGVAMVDGSAKLRQYVEHRYWREARILEALRGGPASLRQIVVHAYSDTAAPLHPLAERSALATLIKLEREGRVAADGERYSARTP